jgi:hypothetical protein
MAEMMGGLLSAGTENEDMEGAEQTPSGANQGKAGAEKFRTKVVDALPPDMKEPFERVVLAGTKIMVSDEMQDVIDREFGANKPTFQKLGESVAGLMGLIGAQAKNMPPAVVIPAGIELLHEAAAFIGDTNRAQVSPDDIKRATQYFVVLMMQGQGASKDQITQALTGGAGAPGEGEAAGPPAQPGMAQPAGLLGG